MPEEQCADQRHHQKLFAQLGREIADGPLDQRTAVVGGDDLDARRQAALQLRQLGLDGSDRLLCILAGAQHHHAAGDLAFSVEFGNATPHLRAYLERSHIPQPHRHTAPCRQGDLPELVQGLEVAARADHVLCARQLQDGASGLLVGPHQGIADLSLTEPIGRQLDRVEHDLVLLDHAPHRCHFGHVGQALEFELEEPVLQRTQLRQIVLARAIHERVLEDPADARGVRTQGRLRRGGQSALDLVQVFQYP